MTKLKPHARLSNNLRHRLKCMMNEVIILRFDRSITSVTIMPFYFYFTYVLTFVKFLYSGQGSGFPHFMKSACQARVQGTMLVTCSPRISFHFLSRLNEMKQCSCPIRYNRKRASLDKETPGMPRIDRSRGCGV